MSESISPKRKRHTPQQMIDKRRSAGVLVSQGLSVGEVAARLGVSEVTYGRWRNQWPLSRRFSCSSSLRRFISSPFTPPNWCMGGVRSPVARVGISECGSTHGTQQRFPIKR